MKNLHKNNLLKTILFIASPFISQVASAGCIGVGADPLRPLNAIAEKANSLLQEKNFKQLELLAAQYRLPNSFASDGQPNLVGFYEGVSKQHSNCKNLKETDQQWDDHRALLLAWDNEIKNSITSKIALASFELAYGWHVRGSGMASTVSQNQWVLFKDRVNKAKLLLDGYKPEVRNDPGWHSSRLQVALALQSNKKEFDKIYNNAIKKFPYYYELYYTNLSFHSSEWYGSDKEANLYFEQAVKLTKSKIGPSMYGRLYTQIQNDMFTSGRADWPKMKIGFERIIQDYPDPWNYNKFAKFACIAKDTDTLSKQLQLIGNKVSTTQLEDEWFKYCKNLSDRASGKKCYKTLDVDYTWCE